MLARFVPLCFVAQKTINGGEILLFASKKNKHLSHIKVPIDRPQSVQKIRVKW